jgi:serpin B
MKQLLKMAAASALVCTVSAQAADTTTPAALADLGLALLRQGTPANAVVSPVAAAAALGMVHAGANGAAEHEIEALFGPGPRSFKTRLPALLQAVGAGAGPAPFVMAGRVWIDTTVAAAVPTGFTQRLATRYQADASRVAFKDTEAVRGQINTWTAQHTAGRITELLPTGSVSAATQVTLTAAIHFRSAWDKPFDAEATADRPFTNSAGQTKPVPTLVDERGVLQAEFDGTRVMALPFAGARFTLLLALPATGSDLGTLLKGLTGTELARWQAGLKPQKCALALPKFKIDAKATALRPVLESLGVKTAFTPAADLRPMLGRQAKGVHLADVHHAAGITIDERGGEAVAAAAATAQGKSLALPVPPCAVDRPFVFAVVHAATGTPLFMGRVGDPAAAE